MKRRPNAELKTGSSTLPIVATALATGIFIVDTITDLEIAVAVLYVAVILMAIGFCRKRGVIIVSSTCAVLTIISFFLTRTGSLEAGLINCGISLLAIGATTFLVLRIESAELVAHEARSQLAHIARVTTMGEMAAAIAHEINQPLAAIVTSGDACLRRLGAQPTNLEKARRAVRRMVEDANRASKIIGRVRDLAKGTPAQAERFSINKAIREIIALTRGEIEASGISVQVHFSDDLPLVLGDKIQTQQVVLNLVRNAIEALRELGDGPREILIRTANGGANNVLIVVRDTGVGFEPGKLDRVYDAFYTTKREGLGLGLTISRSIVEAHGGHLWATSNVPRGAIFQFTIPVKKAANT